MAKQGGIIENFDLESKNMVETLKLSGEVIGMYAQNDTLIMADDCGKFSMGTFEPEYKEISCLNIESKLARMAFHDNHFATGGEEIDLKVYSISSETPVFTAKNVKNDYLDLRQPVSILDIQFFPNSTAKLATSTKYHQLRIYDTKAQMRPVHSFEVGDLPLKHLLIIDEITALASDTKNSLFKIDLRNGRISGKFPGLAGAVTSIAKSPIDSSIIVGSLDRHVRIYDLNSTKLLSKVHTLVIFRHMSSKR